MSPRRRIVSLLPTAFLALGCAATTARSYDEPIAYTQFAAQEACAMAGFQFTRVAPNEIQGLRPVRLGLIAGQGNERIEVRLDEVDSGTAVEITSRKPFLFFFAARHHDELVARYLDDLVLEDRDLRARILNGAR